MPYQGRLAEEVLDLMNSSQAKLDPSSRFSPTATQPSALKGPNRVPHNARITPMPQVTARARAIAMSKRPFIPREDCFSMPAEWE